MRQDCIVELVLDSVSSERLKRDYVYSGIEKIFCDHVTLGYKPDSESDVYKWALEHDGECVLITVYSIGNSELAEACGVILPDGVPCENSQPHITIGTYPGGKPVDSNKIKSWFNIDKNFLLLGTVKILPLGKK